MEKVRADKKQRLTRHGSRNLGAGSDVQRTWSVSFLEHMLLKERRPWKKRNREPLCNDKTKALPVLNKCVNLKRFQSR